MTKKIDGAAISSTARALYGREMSQAQSAAIGEIVGRLCQSATETAALQPMEIEPAQFGASLAAVTKGGKS